VNPGVVVAIIVPSALLLAGLLGWLVKFLIGRYDREVLARAADREKLEGARTEDRKEYERQLAQIRQDYERKIAQLDQALDLKTETVQDLRRQVSELHITAQLQEKFLSRLPPSPRPTQGD